MSQVLLLSLIGDLVRDGGELLSAEAKGRALDAAVRQYGRDVPALVVVDVTAGGGPKLDYPAGYDPTTCRIDSIEYPLNQVPPSRLTADQWGDYPEPDGVRILASIDFTAGTTVRIGYTAPRAADDIPVVDLEAVAAYAAAILLDQMAIAKSGDSDVALLADSVRPGDKGKGYAERAATQRQRYYDLLGIDTKRVTGASVTVQVASPASDGGDRFWNRRGRRR